MSDGIGVYGAGGGFLAGVSTGGNTAGSTGTIGGQVVFVGSNLTLSQSTNAQSATITISAPATVAQTAYQFDNANGVSFGTAGSTVTATVQTNYLTTAMASNRGTDFVQATAAFAGTSASGTIASNGISVSIGPYLTTAALSNHSHGVTAGNGGFNFQTLSFSNANGISFGTSAGSAITGSHNALTTAMASNRGSDFVQATAAFNGTNASGTIASDAISISVAAPGGAGAAASFYMWPDEIQNTSNWTVSGSTSYLQPVYIPYDISASYIRLKATLSAIGSMAAVGTANNVSRGMTQSSTINVGFYSQGTGASSRSLMSYATSSATWVQQARIHAAGTGSHWTSGHTISYPFEGGDTNFTSSGGATSASFTMQSSQLTNFTGMRFIDIPFATSLAQGAYWFMYGSSTQISTSGTANISTVRITCGNVAATQINAAWNLMGAATNSSNHFRNGLGSWSTNSIGTIMNSIALANISTSASNPILLFQMIRQA